MLSRANPLPTLCQGDETNPGRRFPRSEAMRPATCQGCQGFEQVVGVSPTTVLYLEKLPRQNPGNPGRSPLGSALTCNDACQPLGGRHGRWLAHPWHESKEEQ